MRLQTLVSIVALSISLRRVVGQDNLAPGQVNVDREVDFETCYDAMGRSDIDGDKNMDRDEFLLFVKDFGGLTECLGQTDELPLTLILVWTQVSCECRNRGGTDDCCYDDKARIPIQGSAPGDEIIIGEQSYLRQACLRTDQAIIAFCGLPPPPPPPVVPIGSALLVPQTRAAPAPSGSSNAGRDAGIIVGAIVLLLILLCCCRRRWFFCAGGKKVDSDDSSSSSEETTEPGDEVEIEQVLAAAPPAEIEEEAAVPVPMEEEEEELEEEEILDPDADKNIARMNAEEEDDDGGRSKWGREVEEEEYVDLEDPLRLGPIEQLPPPEDPEEGLKLRPVVIPPPPPPEEDPYELEHYEPDGGIVEHERNWEGGYDADGGWTPEEREEAGPSEPYRYKYEREVPQEVEPVDNRKQRRIAGLEGGAVWDQLGDEEEEQQDAAPASNDMFDWVIRTTLNTLDHQGDQLQDSDPDDA